MTIEGPGCLYRIGTKIEYPSALAPYNTNLTNRERRLTGNGFGIHIARGGERVIRSMQL